MKKLLWALPWIIGAILGWWIGDILIAAAHAPHQYRCEQMTDGSQLCELVK